MDSKMEKIRITGIKNITDVRDTSDSLTFLKKDLDFSKENLILIGLNTKNKVIFTKKLFVGGLDSCIIDQRILFKEILLNSCSGFIIGHNHPSNDLTPSNEDLSISRKVHKISRLLNLRFLDNVIFSEKQYISFFDESIGGF